MPTTHPRHPKSFEPTFRPMSDERLLVAMDMYDGITASLHYGANPVIGTSFEVLSSIGQTAPLLLTVPTTLAVSSSSADDDGSPVGTGARTVLITGLGAEFLPLTEVVTLNGTTDVITTGLFCRVNAFQVVSSGTGKTNAGDVYIRDDAGSQSSGVPSDLADVLVKIRAGFSVADSIIYTTPAGFTLFVSLVEIYGGGGSTVTYQGKILIDAIDTVIVIFEGVLNDYQAAVRRSAMVKLTEKNTVWIEGKVSTSTTELTAIVDGWLVDNAKYNL